MGSDALRAPQTRSVQAICDFEHQRVFRLHFTVWFQPVRPQFTCLPLGEDLRHAVLHLAIFVHHLLAHTYAHDFLLPSLLHRDIRLAYFVVKAFSIFSNLHNLHQCLARYLGIFEDGPGPRRFRGINVQRTGTTSLHCFTSIKAFFVRR